jgi:hypothetical protein
MLIIIISSKLIQILVDVFINLSEPRKRFDMFSVGN